MTDSPTPPLLAPPPPHRGPPTHPDIATPHKSNLCVRGFVIVNWCGHRGRAHCRSFPAICRTEIGRTLSHVAALATEDERKDGLKRDLSLFTCNSARRRHHVSGDTLLRRCCPSALARRRTLPTAEDKHFQPPPQEVSCAYVSLMS